MRSENEKISQCKENELSALAKLLAESFPYVFEETLGLSRTRTVRLLEGLMKMFRGNHYWGYKRFHVYRNKDGGIIAFIGFAGSGKQPLRNVILAFNASAGLIRYSGFRGLFRTIAKARKNFGASPALKKSELYVSYIAVDKNHRGRGLGKQLLGIANEHAKKSGKQSIGLDVRENNLPAIALFRSSGYRTVRTIDDHAFSGVPRLYMQKKLNPGSRGG